MTRFFVQKAALGAAGLLTGLAGIATERRWLVWVAIGLLTLAVALRIAERTAWGGGEGGGGGAHL
ncbi:MAG TPA: hypothetical protein VLV16_14610 [Gemmatimonadales bacterium]|nr:hypothetical protein [Gemmatimonadales bacterium]